ncbi:MAG: hypothetical protein JSV99_04810, partial [Planctomycetota bacterium]
MRNLMFIWLCLFCVIPSQARTITVDDDGPADFNNIQAAIDAAVHGDEVICADGTYTGPGNRDIDFLGKAITVRSQSGPENCVIDCGYRGGNWYIGISLKNGERSDSVIAGLTITGAYGAYGAAIACQGSSPV